MDELGTIICLSQVGLVTIKLARPAGESDWSRNAHQYCRKVMSSRSSESLVVSTSVVLFLPKDWSLGLLGPLTRTGRWVFRDLEERVRRWTLLLLDIGRRGALEADNTRVR